MYIYEDTDIAYPNFIFDFFLSRKQVQLFHDTQLDQL